MPTTTTKMAASTATSGLVPRFNQNSDGKISSGMTAPLCRSPTSEMPVGECHAEDWEGPHFAPSSEKGVWSRRISAFARDRHLPVHSYSRNIGAVLVGEPTRSVLRRVVPHPLLVGRGVGRVARAPRFGIDVDRFGGVEGGPAGDAAAHEAADDD